MTDCPLPDDTTLAVIGAMVLCAGFCLGAAVCTWVFQRAGEEAFRRGKQVGFSEAAHTYRMVPVERVPTVKGR